MPEAPPRTLMHLALRTCCMTSRSAVAQRSTVTAGACHPAGRRALYKLGGGVDVDLGSKKWWSVRKPRCPIRVRKVLAAQRGHAEEWPMYSILTKIRGTTLDRKELENYRAQGETAVSTSGPRPVRVRFCFSQGRKLYLFKKVYRI
eukprot:gene17848-biopygen11417